MNKALKTLAVLLCAGSIFTCCVANEDNDCGCKNEEEKQEEKVVETLETMVEETCECECAE